MNQVRRGRGFWPVIAIPAPDGRSATLAVRNNDESFRGKGKDSKNTTHKGKSKGSKSGKSGKNKGGKGKSSGKSSVKSKGDPLKQRLVSRTQCRLCGEEGHWEEDCPQADVDMPQAKRRVTFPRPVGVGVSQVWGVETWTVSPSTESAESQLKTWTSRNPLLSFATGILQSRSATSNGHDLLSLNKLMREAKSMPDPCWWIVSVPSSFVWPTAADAAWANRPDGSSTSGHVIMAAHPNILRGESSTASVLAWNSRKIRQVVTSSLGAECAAFSTGLEHTDMLQCGPLKKFKRARISWVSP